jgi:hypothetical protein
LDRARKGAPVSDRDGGDVEAVAFANLARFVNLRRA